MVNGELKIDNFFIEYRVTVQNRNSHPVNIIISEGQTRTSPAFTDKYPDNRIKAKVLHSIRTK